jgi:large subunit ribosomal protein L22
MVLTQIKLLRLSKGSKMISKAVIKYTRLSPRKARTVIPLIKGKDVKYALGLLRNSNNKASELLYKLLNSAVANAKRFPNINEDELYISDVYADGGPVLKRFRAEAMGRASVLRKPTSHVTVILDTKNIAEKIAVKKPVAGKAIPAVLKKQKEKKPKKKVLSSKS